MLSKYFLDDIKKNQVSFPNCNFRRKLCCCTKYCQAEVQELFLLDYHCDAAISTFPCFPVAMGPVEFQRRMLTALPCSAEDLSFPSVVIVQ